jgi:predicted DNA-binding transcriptional regulator YafY
VLELLQSRPSISGAELADRLECDIRTVRRYIGKLQDVDIPVESLPGPYGGYRLRPGYRLPPLVLTEEESVVVVLGLVTAQWLGVGVARTAIETALSKISRMLPVAVRRRVDDVARLVVFPQQGQFPETGLVLDLSRACADRRCVRFHYVSGSESTRTVEPYGVAGYQRHWYLVGFCRLRAAIRVFRLDRVSGFETTDETFAPPERFDVQSYIDEAIASQRWRVGVWFEAAPEQVRQAVGGTVTAQEVGCLYEGPASDLDLLARQLLLSRLKFRVVTPPELREALTAVAAEALRYSSEEPRQTV